MTLGLIKLLQGFIVDKIFGKEFNVENVIVNGLWTEAGLLEPCPKTGDNWCIICANTLDLLVIVACSDHMPPRISHAVDKNMCSSRTCCPRILPHRGASVSSIAAG